MSNTSEQQVTFTKSEGSAGSDVCLLLGEVDLVTEAQGHPLLNEGGRIYWNSLYGYR